MSTFDWPKYFPEMSVMFDLLQKTAKASWRNDLVFNSDVINNWLNNFTGEIYSSEIEQRIALWMLCNFTYYNEEEINHLCHIVFKYFIHKVALQYPIKEKSDLNSLLGRTYFAAMGNPSESGGLVLYFFRQQARLSIDSFYYPSALPEDEDGIIVFIDDVTLSGDSASTFFEKNLKAMKYRYAYYLTLFASDEAISKIGNYGINVIAATTLGERDKCFSEDSLLFHNFPDLRETAKSIAMAYGRKLSPNHPLGHKNGQYCFGLHYNIPNNTLPIFWSNKKDWTPIFQRKEKNNGRRKTDFDKFI